MSTCLFKVGRVTKKSPLIFKNILYNRYLIQHELNTFYPSLSKGTLHIGQAQLDKLLSP